MPKVMSFFRRTRTYELTTEAHVFQNIDEWYLFFPLFGLIFKGNEDSAKLLQALRRQPLLPANERQREMLDYWQKLGLVNNRSFEKKNRLAEFSFSPTSVTLFLTTACNLACVYCYADANKHPEHMDPEIAEAAINHILFTAQQSEIRDVYLGLHGGGEPTKNWKLFSESILLFKKRAQEKHLIPHVNIGTNGMLTHSMREFIAKETEHATISLDGLAKHQNFLRPTRRGGRTFSHLCETLLFFDKVGYEYGIRATVTSYNVAVLPEFIQWIGEKTKCKKVKCEPVMLVGRAAHQLSLLPKEQDFIRFFMIAKEKGRDYQVDVSYSGAGIRSPGSVFCSVASNFFVTQSGLVTPCLEIISEEDVRAESFFYGRYNSKTRSFEFDLTKLKKLQQAAQTNLKKCGECLAKSYCAGDCLAKRGFKPEDASGLFADWRCRVNVELAKLFLIDTVRHSNDFVAHSAAYKANLPQPHSNCA